MLDDAKLIDIIEPLVSAAGFTLYDAECGKNINK